MSHTVVSSELSVTSTMQYNDSSTQMTMEVTAGADDCFFVNDMKIGQTLSVEYQVTEI